MILMIDNYDSFTYNIVQYLIELGADVKVIRNDECSVADIADYQAEKIVLSPGPCTPKEAGICMDVIREYGGKIPMLGVCLGFQCIGEVFGAPVIRAGKVMHGKTSDIYHQQQGVFQDLPSPFKATRYHSLVVDKNQIPSSLTVTAWTENKDGSVEEIMGLKHESLAIEGVQFHPESIVSEYGKELLNNFISEG